MVPLIEGDIILNESIAFRDGLSLVPASTDNSLFILALRNDPILKSGFIQQDEISLSDHEEYMSVNLNNYYVCLLHGKPIGYIGIIDNDIRVAVATEFVGQGAGEFMVRAILAIYPNAIAKIKVGNVASIKLFEKCGFEKKYFILEQKTRA